MRRAGLALALAVALGVAAPAHARGTPSVAALQVALRARGERVRVDGVLGPRTRAAVRRFQRHVGLRVDGVAGPVTRRALGRLGRPSFGSRLLRRGRVGWDVSVLQFALLRHGFPAGRVDGVFGRATADAVRAYQRYAGLRPDAIAGRATVAVLRRAGAGRGVGEEVGAEAVAIARRLLGVPYLWGGEDPDAGFDCSGLVRYVYGRLGISLPHFTGSQWRAGPTVPRSELRPGDLVFYDPIRGVPHHVGIYAGHGWQIEAPHTGDVVRFARVRAKARALGYVGAVRPY